MTNITLYLNHTGIKKKFFLKILFIYLTEIETAREKGNTSRGSGRGRSRLLAEESDVGLDPRTPGVDHALSRRQTLNDCATQAPQERCKLTPQ